MTRNLDTIALKFKIEGDLQSAGLLGEGFINDTFLVKTLQEDKPDYLLQRKNRHVFRNIPALMENIHRVTSHLKRKTAERGGDPSREVMTVIPATDGQLFFRDEDGEYWAMSRYIENSFTYERVTGPKMAYEGGKGIGVFHALLTDMNKPLADTIPGFHNMRYRLVQWNETLENDRLGRKAGLGKEIEWIEKRSEEMLEFYKRFENGTIPVRVSHNDTKINNILFDFHGKALCMIDLDTVMNSTLLNDFGDAVRTYANTGMEDDPDPGKVSMDLNIFKAFTAGYLEEAASFLTRAERDHLAFSARYITYEQILRFLMDHIDGDRYYRIRFPGHNLQRAHAQYRLLLSMERQYNDMLQVVREYLP